MIDQEKLNMMFTIDSANQESREVGGGGIDSIH